MAIFTDSVDSWFLEKRKTNGRNWWTYVLLVILVPLQHMEPDRHEDPLVCAQREGGDATTSSPGWDETSCAHRSGGGVPN